MLRKLKRLNRIRLINERLKNHTDGWNTGVIYLHKNYLKKGYSIIINTEDWGDFSLNNYTSKKKAIAQIKKYAEDIRKSEKEIQNENIINI